MVSHLPAGSALFPTGVLPLPDFQNPELNRYTQGLLGLVAVGLVPGVRVSLALGPLVQGQPHLEHGPGD